MKKEPLGSNTGGGGVVELVAIAVGNTRTRLGRFYGKDLNDPVSLPNSDLDPIAAHVERLLESTHGCPIVMATVNPAVADRLQQSLLSRTGDEVYRIGEDLVIPMRHTLDDASTVGQDRLLNALAAYSRAKQACVIIDAGTAITVDFVDGEGTFQGGVIAPGLNLMLKAMHENTAALPLLVVDAPDAQRGPFGKDTRHAMTLGVINASRGLARIMIDQYAEAFGAYPQVVATGGDAPLLFENEPLVEHIVPDLQLLGIAAVVAATVSDTRADNEDEQE